MELLLLLICASPFVSSLKPGDFFQVCKKSDPQLGECIRDTVNNLKPKLIKGIPELKITPLDPLFIEDISLKQGSGPVSLDSNFKNVRVTGLSGYKAGSVTADIEKYSLEMEVQLPYMFTEGNYTMNGKVLALPIVGEGTSYSNYTDLQCKGHMKLEPYTRNSKRYLNVTSLTIDMSVKHADIHMDNLFNGNKQLGDTMNKFISENWEEVFKELKPVVEEAVAAVMLDIATKIFNKFPENLILPD